MTLVTGFLGSGKTTVINAALRSPELARTVVVVNEFGEVGLDHQLFASSSDSVVVLENGCLCCTVRSDLVGTLNSLYHARQAGEIAAFDNLVIETSGLAEPGPGPSGVPFGADPGRPLSGRERPDAGRCGQLGGNVRSARGIRCARSRSQIKSGSPNSTWSPATGRTACHGSGSLSAGSTRPPRSRRSTWSSAAVAKLLTSSGFDTADPAADPRPWLNVHAYQNAAHDHDGCDDDHDHHEHDHSGPAHGHHLDGKGIETFVLTRESPLTREETQFLLDGIAQNLGSGLLRVKGLVNIAEEPGRPAVIQGAQHLLHTMTWLDRWPDADQRTRIVFITQGIPRDSLKDIIDLLDRVSSRTFKARARGRKAHEAARATTQTE